MSFMTKVRLFNLQIRSTSFKIILFCSRSVKFIKFSGCCLYLSDKNLFAICQTPSPFLTSYSCDVFVSSLFVETVVTFCDGVGVLIVAVSGTTEISLLLEEDSFSEQFLMTSPNKLNATAIPAPSLPIFVYIPSFELISPSLSWGECNII